MLIRIARDEILKRLGLEGQHSSRDIVIPEALRIKSGAFVSLYVNEKLRGCIGTFSEEEEIYKNVRRLAYTAAAHDNRFPSIRSDEARQLKIEISILSPRLPVGGPEEIVLGRHGIYMESGGNRGTLLPQVAIDQQWNVEEFLGNCAKYKAGLGWDGWKSARLFTYEAIVFDSDEAWNC